jgi:hypothetical protein
MQVFPGPARTISCGLQFFPMILLIKSFNWWRGKNAPEIATNAPSECKSANANLVGGLGSPL